MTRWGALAAALFVTALLAGCGGGGSSDGGDVTAGDVSKDEYIAQANKICRESDDEFQKATEDLPDNPSQDEIVATIDDSIVPILRDTLDQLRALEAPQADVDELTGIYDGLQGEIDAVDEDPEKFAGQSANPFEESSAAFTDYGMDDCGS
jgi:hypothetical protein